MHTHQRFGKDIPELVPDVPLVNLGAIRAHMPPGVEPLPDHFDVLELVSRMDNPDAKLAQGDPAPVSDHYIRSRVAFTLRASYEAMRDAEVAAATHVDRIIQAEAEIKDLRAKINADFTTERSTYTFRITQAGDPVSDWAIPGTLLVRVHRDSPYFSTQTPRHYRYVLMSDENDRPASTQPAMALKVLKRIQTMFAAQQEELDPQVVLRAVENWRSIYTTLDDEILKICEVEPRHDVPTLVVVQNLADHARQLSLENVRLREERDAAKNGDYIHPRRYVHGLEETIIGLGRLLGHKTFPTQGGPVPYTKQMTNYCSRLLQAVRTRMSNIKSKQRSK